ncbi:matrixin family metalloprotease [Arthrobacter sp. UYCo732]|uniref:matrixin family metalloprotease n=1 Tax=Arthrobacter sp. UYCo732 TaxID=3156336 RepID=UPI003394F2A0
MDGQSVDLTDPPLTRREVRRREEAARTQQPVPEPSGQELPPPEPPRPAPDSTAPRSSPSGRVPQWAVDDAAGNPPQDTGWRGGLAPVTYDWETKPHLPHQAFVPPSVRYPSPIKRFFRALGSTVRDIVSGVWSFVKFLALAAILSVAGWNALTHFAPGMASDIEGWGASYGIRNPLPEILAGGWPPSTSNGGAPPPGADSDQPLGVPAPAAGNSSSYAFLSAGTDQAFVSYDPCRPIHYVVRPDRAPAGGEQAIADAVAEVSRATGFVFVNDGFTSEGPSQNRAAKQENRYGDRWAPVLFAWETTAEQPQFRDNLGAGSTTLGLGGSISVTVSGKNPTYVTGQVRLNAAALAKIGRGYHGQDRLKAVVQHELAHVIGLDHVPDSTQLMAATMTEESTDFGAGDLAGLAILGTGKCRPDL